MDGQYYALKACKKSAIIKMKQVEHIRNEVNLLSKIDHPTIVNMLGVFQDNTKLYIVMEYVEGGEVCVYTNMLLCTRLPSLIDIYPCHSCLPT